MPAAYDTYDYPTYWKDRDYEHKSEIIAVRYLMSKIKNINTLVDIGAGFGRLTSIYLHRAKRIILVDPSARLLKIARNRNRSGKINFIQSSVENLSSKLRKNSCDMVLLVRVAHHLKHLDDGLSVIEKICKKGGYLIIEFPNKKHLKEIIKEIIKGNLTYAIDIFPKDRRSKKSIRKKVIPFINYHPDYMTGKLEEYNFKIVEKIGVSFLRSSFLKNYIPLEALLTAERFMQKNMSSFNLSPSIFILARKI